MVGNGATSVCGVWLGQVVGLWRVVTDLKLLCWWQRVQVVMLLLVDVLLLACVCPNPHPKFL